MKSATITKKGQIALPREVRKQKGFREGDKIAIFSYGDRIELRPLSYMEKIATAIASETSLGKEWNTKREDRRWKHL